MICSVDGCEKKVQAKGLCYKHYARVRRNGTTETVYRQTEITHCTVAGCDRRIEARGLCHMHYSRQRRGSDLTQVASRVRGGPVIERVERRTGEADSAGCRIWQGPVNGGSQLPFVRYQGLTRSVRRVLWQDMYPQVPLAPAQWVITTCGTPRCVAREHLRLSSVHEYNSKHMVTSR